METPRSQSSIMKIIQLDAEQHYTRIIVFHGKREPVKSLHEIFSDVEILHIEAEKTQVVFSTQEIHPDDNIQTIKYKLIQALDANMFSYHEIYFFADVLCSPHLERTYQEITQQDEKEFTRLQMGQLLLNVELPEEIVETIQDKPTYTYDDVRKIISSDILPISLPIGKQFSSFRQLLFTANPFLLSDNGTIFQPTSQNPLQTYENHLLFHYGELVNNTLFVCFAKDVLHYAKNQHLDEKTILQLYYPLLAKENIVDQSTWMEQNPRLIEQNNVFFTSRTEQIQTNIDMFYDVFSSSSPPLNYLSRGITILEMILHPEIQTVVPLELLFKQIHATNQMPFIKYNPGSRQENMYRLYSENRSASGQKIPLLSKSKIISLSKQTGKSRQLSFYILEDGSIESLEWFLDFDYDGNVHVRCEFSVPILVEEMENLVKKVVNGVINTMNTFLQQTGYRLNLFPGFSHDLVEMVQLKYTCEYAIREHIQLADYTGCLTTVFDILDGNVQKGAILKYKRVANYKEMNDIQSMITDIYGRTNNEKETLDALMANFQLSWNEAYGHVTAYLNEYTRVQGPYVNKAVSIVENPGFFSTLRVIPFENKLVWTVEKINAIAYIDLLHVYMDSFLRITQEPETIPGIKSVRSICSRKKMTPKQEPVFDTVIVPVPFSSVPFTPVPLLHKVDRDFFDVEEEEEDAEENEDDFLVYDDEEEEAEAEADADAEAEEEEDFVVYNDDQEEDQDQDQDQSNTLTGGTTAPQYSKLFLEKMYKLDPALFLTTTDGQYNSYARICRSAFHRPVILTDDEKEKIDKEHRDAYTTAIRYGSNPDKKFWYICPRYWCMSTNTPITEKEVNEGVCKDQLLEFNTKTHLDVKGKYVNHNPSLVLDAHPKKYGVPCCFKKEWNAEQLQKQREAYDIGEEDISLPSDQQGPVRVKKAPIEDENRLFYIVGFDKYPLPPDRWGFLPPSMQTLLEINYQDVITKKNAALIQPGAKTFLRFGVEQSKTQSFLGCLANVYASIHRFTENQRPTIAQMRGILLDAITIDQYLQYHNGSLVSVFRPPRRELEPDVLAKYNSSLFRQTIDMTQEAQLDFWEYTIASFEHFQAFLRDETATIDHTYLWDIVSQPNNKLFPGGLNLVLFEIHENDITDHVELICPTNSLSSKLYYPTRETVILLKHDEFYEPIYLYHIDVEGRNKNITWNTTFIENTAPPMIQHLLRTIEHTSENYCRPVPSRPKEYKYKRNISAEKILYLLRTAEKPYTVTSQVRDYRGKIIALLVQETEGGVRQIYLPCYPSSALPNLPFTWSDQVTWTAYTLTRDFFIQLKKDIPEILCAPLLKVVEKGMIVGVLTETNQFVASDPPIANDDSDDLHVFESVGFGENGYMQAEKAVSSTPIEDKKRMASIRHVSLESQFYTVFRMTARILLAEHDRRPIREQIVHVLDHDGLLAIRRKQLVFLLKTLLQNDVRFSEIEESILSHLEDIHTCLSNYDNKKYCLVENQTYHPVLLLPKKNLFDSTQDNEEQYYWRLADELIRYRRIRLFLLEPKRLLNLNDTEYQLNADELILLQSLLEGHYFDDLLPISTNAYAENIPFDLAHPEKSQKYSRTVTLEKQQEVGNETNRQGELFVIHCIKETKEVMGNTKSEWKRIFPITAKEMTIHPTPLCTFYLMMYIYQQHTKKTISMETLKGVLSAKYQQLLPKYSTDILSILGKQGGKKEMMNRVKTSRISLDALIKSEEYYLTNLDIWVLASTLDLPILLFSTKPLQNLRLTKNWILLGGRPRTDAYFGLRSPVDSKDAIVPPYQMIKSAIRLQELRENFFSKITDVSFEENHLTLESYFEKYS
jgi:hypothetical protein